MDVSVVVCTRNRAAQLDACLQSLAALRPAGQCEIVIVDNGSSDATPKVIEAFRARSPIPVKAVQEPNKGLANARNAGLAAAEGRILAFTDDDCYPARDWLQAVMATFADPAIGYAAGRVLLHDQDDYPITILLDEQPQVFPPRTYLRTGSLQGANMAFRAAALEEVGGFDPLFGAGSLFPAEDIDAAARVNLAGWTGRFSPDLVVSHHHGRKAADVPALMAGYDIGRGAYNMKVLLSGGRLRWFARANLELAQRLASNWRSAAAEWRAQWDYLGQRMRRQGQSSRPDLAR